MASPITEEWANVFLDVLLSDNATLTFNVSEHNPVFKVQQGNRLRINLKSKPVQLFIVNPLQILMVFHLVSHTKKLKNLEHSSK
jgi:hypothetical protein